MDDSSIAPWSSLSSDPHDVAVIAMQRTWAESKRHPDGIVDWRDELIRHSRRRTVLDIGFVEHDLSYMDSPDWEHAVVTAAAERCLGIDIVKDAVAAAGERGFEVAVMDATSEESLGELFDLIIIGDVIEHVQSPQLLLEFAARHLRNDGRILLKTPNPLFLIYTLKCLLTGAVIPNADHVAWFTPDNFRELGDRSGLTVDWFAGARGPARRAWVNAIKQQRWLLRDNPVTWQSLVVQMSLARP